MTIKQDGDCDKADDVGSRPRKVIILIFVFIIVIILSGTIGMCVGIIIGERRVEHRQFLEQQDLVRPILSSDPAFHHVTIHENEIGGVFLAGWLDSKEDFYRLRLKLISQIGEKNADFMLHGMNIGRQ